MTTKGERLYQARVQKNYTRSDVAKLTGINDKLLFKYEKDIITNIPLDNLEKLCELYGLNPAYVVGWEDDMPQTPISQYPYCPDAVAAGIPCTIEGIKQLPTVSISDAIMGKYAGNNHILIMRVNGESMNRIIPNGSFVAVKRDLEVTELKEGDTVVFNKSHEYSLKHYHKVGDKIIFRPDSTDNRYFDQVYSTTEDIAIVGKVVKYIVSLD